MLTLRKSEERGHGNHGWLDSYHTFSFGSYYDPRHMGFRHLRVINQDRIAGGSGFGPHGHRDMEIVSYVIEGGLEHKDSMGNGSILRRVQRMSAGRGVTHSEFNPSPTDPGRFLQIWILPERENLEPSYEEKHFGDDRKRNRLCPIVSRDGREDSLHIHQDAVLYASLLDRGAELPHAVPPHRYGWVQVVAGDLQINELSLTTGDGVAIEAPGTLRLQALRDAEFLVFDLA
ncbi:MAG: pirin family protein [Pseudanabaenaceae cyanobacterium]